MSDRRRVFWVKFSAQIGDNLNPKTDHRKPDQNDRKISICAQLVTRQNLLSLPPLKASRLRIDRKWANT